MKSPSQKFAEKLRSKRLLILLDYDGTLTDFDDDPERSRLSKSNRALLYRLKRRYPVIFVSGRHVEGLRRVSGLKGFPMVGTHGFEAEGLPGGLQMAPPALRHIFRSEARRLWRALQPLTRQFPGIHIERKPYSSTLHYRGVELSKAQVEGLHHRFLAVFRKTVTRRLWSLQEGKKMIEAMPCGFSKGKAVGKILAKYRGFFPLYAGDDVTDITVFKRLGKRGLKIAVGSRIPAGLCDLRLDSPRSFLAWLRALARG